MSCGFWMRLNGVWVALPGVQAGVPREAERPSSSFTSVGGVRHSQAARRAARSWTLDFGQAGPEAVTALAVAAQGDGGDVMLWDESIARQNLLDPVPLTARPGYPVVMCGTTPLRSLTAGPGATPTMTKDVELKANLSIHSMDGSGMYDFLGLAPDSIDALLKIDIPPTPAGMDLIGADLLLTSVFGFDGTITAHVASNAWTENTDADYWNTIPAGAALGSAPAAARTVVPLGDLSAYVGTDLSLRLAQTGGTSGSTFRGRYMTDPPIVRLKYTVLAQDRVFEQHLRPGDYTIGFWTDAPEGAEFGQASGVFGDTPGPLVIPEGTGTGWRYVGVSFSLPSSLDLRMTIWDSTNYLLAGGMISTINHPDVYMAAQKTPVHAHVEDPTLVLDRLFAGEQGVGQRTVTIREVGV